MNRENLAQDIKRAIREVRDLPTLPLIAQETARLLVDPKSNMSRLAEVIEQDVALAGRILRVANSAFYGVPRKIDNLKMALVILGLNEVNNLVATLSILRLFPMDNGEPGRSFDMTAFWRHSAFCAELTVGLHTALRQPSPSSAYVAGLLHDVGKLFMDQNFHDLFVKCLNYSHQNDIPFYRAEMELMGMDHGQIGSWLISRWNLPEDISEAVAQHHIRSSDIPAYGLAAMVEWANLLAHNLADLTVEAAMARMDDHKEWNIWIGAKGVPSSKIIQFLHNRLERARQLFNLLG